MIPIPAIGSLIRDRYRIEDIIDATGECIVLKCLDTRLDVKCAIKRLMIEPQDPGYTEKKQAFLDAIRAQARLNHPNIANVSNIEAKDDMVFSVMELLNGFTLQEFLETTELIHKEIVEIFLSVADVVNTAHAMQILHKSISPKTIFLNRLGNRLSPQMLNFSIAKNVSILDPHTVLPYLAPEQLVDFNCSSPASDIFAICATIYYAFLHRPPVCFDSLEAYIDYYNNGGCPIEFPTSIPQDFARLIEAGLAPNPVDRIVSADALLKSLKKIGSAFNLSANLTISASRNAGSTSTPSIQSHTGSISATSGERRITANTGQLRLKHVTRSISQQAFADLSAPAVPKVRRPTYSNPAFQAFADSILPEPLALVWKLQRIDSQLEHACICAISRYDDPDNISIVKFLRSKDPYEIRTFNESVQHTFILARECQYFQNIVRDYAECAAFLTDEIPKKSLPETIQANGAFMPVVAAQIGILIAQAMERAHQHGFVNGNLKPSNIFFETHDTTALPVIYDFGQKLYIDSASRLLFSDIAFVDPALDYNLQNTTVRSDIYAFGMLLIYMLLGRIPFDASNPADLIAEIDTVHAIPDLIALRNDIPPDFAQFIYWCTAFDPANRYHNFTDVLRDLYILFNQLQYAPFV